MHVLRFLLEQASRTIMDIVPTSMHNIRYTPWYSDISIRDANPADCTRLFQIALSDTGQRPSLVDRPNCKWYRRDLSIAVKYNKFRLTEELPLAGFTGMNVLHESDLHDLNEVFYNNDPLPEFINGVRTHLRIQPFKKRSIDEQSPNNIVIFYTDFQWQEGRYAKDQT